MSTSPSLAAMISVGDVIDRYRVLGHVATGGMGSVYVVSDGTTSFAMKVMAGNSPSLRDRFLREIRTSAELEHPNIVRVHDFGVDPRSGPYFVMTLLQGESLDRTIDRAPPRGPPLDSAQTNRILSELFGGAQHAHVRGIVHCDLKPSNVVLEAPHQSVKILDFGIAERSVRELPFDTHQAGTPFWMAPEQFEPGPRSPATDVWALSLVTFYVLTGKPFWLADASEFGALYAEICLHGIPLASRRAADLTVGHLLHRDLDRWFSRCLQRDPSNRFSTAGEAFEALAPLLCSRQIESPSKVRLINPNTPQPPGVTATAEEPHIEAAAATLRQRIEESVRLIAAASTYRPVQKSLPDAGMFAPEPVIQPPVIRPPGMTPRPPHSSISSSHQGALIANAPPSSGLPAPEPRLTASTVALFILIGLIGVAFFLFVTILLMLAHGGRRGDSGVAGASASPSLLAGAGPRA